MHIIKIHFVEEHDILAFSMINFIILFIFLLRIRYFIVNFSL